MKLGPSLMGKVWKKEDRLSACGQRGVSEQRLGGRTPRGPFVWNHGFRREGGAAGVTGAKSDRALDARQGV